MQDKWRNTDLNVECFFFILVRVFSLTTLKWFPRSLLLSKFFPIPGLQLRSISRLIYELATKSYNHLVLHLNYTTF